MHHIRRIFENNARWVEDKLRVDPEFFSNSAKGQAPHFLFIGCADSSAGRKRSSNRRSMGARERRPRVVNFRGL